MAARHWHPLQSLRDHRRRRLAAGLLASSLPWLAGRDAAADDKYFTPVSGLWRLNSNWVDALGQPTNRPVPGDTANLIPLTGPLTATFNSSSIATGLAAVRIDSPDDIATLLQTGGSFSTSMETVGIDGTASLQLQGGTHQVTGDLTLGLNATASGTASVLGTATLTVLGTEVVGSNGQATLTQSAANHSATSISLGDQANGVGQFALTGGTLVVTDTLNVGNAGTGLFNQSGGSHTVNGFLVIGAQSSSTGVYTFDNGYLNVNNTYVGYSGSGAFTQNNGQHFTGTLVVGSETGGSGTYTLNAGTLFVGNIDTIGSLGDGLFIQTGGTHTSAGLTLGEQFANGSAGHGRYELSGGILAVDPLETIGNAGVGEFVQDGGIHTARQVYQALGGGSGSYTMTGGSYSVTNDYHVAYAGTGSFAQSGGLVSIGGNFVVGSTAQSTGTVTLDGGTFQAGGEQIGYHGTGSTFTQTAGSNTATNFITIGDQGDATGTYTLQGGTLSATTMYLGNAGAGTLEVSGGNATFGTALLGLGGTGTLNVSAGNVGVTGTLYVGFGTGGIVNQSGGSVVVSGTTLLGFLNGSSGMYNLSGGSLTTGTLNGSINLTGGAVTAGTWTSTTPAKIGSPAGGSAATLTTGSFAVGAVTIDATGTLALNQSISRTISTATSLTIVPGGVLDLANNGLLLVYGSNSAQVTAVSAALKTGYAGGSWTGPGINSSTLAALVAGGNSTRALGMAIGSDGIVPGLAAGSLIVKYTTNGDANLDGITDYKDFQILINHLNQNVGLVDGWDKGDFNHDGRVDFQDFNILQAAVYQQLGTTDPLGSVPSGLSTPPPVDPASLPEPASLGLFLTATALFTARPRRRRREQST